jgi:hypothetical protein
MVDKSIADELKPDDPVREIADWLKPWSSRYSEDEILGTLHHLIEEMLPRIFAEGPDGQAGFRSSNKRSAKRILKRITSLQKELSDTSDSFFQSLANSNTNLEGSYSDGTGYSFKQALKKNGRQRKKIDELVDTVGKNLQQLTEMCQNEVADPGGIDPRGGFYQNTVAFYAADLIVNFSDKHPTIAAVNELAGLLWGAVTGEGDRDFERASKAIARFL